MEKLARTRTGGSPRAAMLPTKRKLEFSAQKQAGERRRLSAKGRCFYLDLVGRDDLTARFQQELTRRGAVVAQFFDKCVEVLVTNRSSSGRSEGRASGSPATNPSPALGSLSRQSPFSNSPVTSIEPSNGSLALSRGKMAVAMAKKRGQKSGQSDLVTKATDWGTKVWTVTKLEEFLLATKSQSVAAKERKHCKTAGSGSGQGAPKVRTLKAPFIKVEDMSRAYKPLVFEVKVWPTPNVHCSPEGSPFDSPPPRKERAKKRTERSAPAPPKQSAVPLEKKPGYCECCKAHFTDMKMHLQGEQHLTFATNPKNYAALDELISRGTSFADFLLKHTKVKTAGSQSLQPTTAPDSKTKVVERTPGFITPGIVPGTKRTRPASDSADSGGNSPKRLKLVLSPSSVPEETPGAVDSGVCLQPDTRCKTPVKASVVSSDVGQSPLLRSGRRLKRRLSQSDNTETPVPNSEAKKQAVASSPRTLTPDQCDTPPTPKRSPRLSSKMSPAEPKGTKSPLPPQTPQKDKKLPSFNVAVVVADVSPTQKGLKVVMSPASPCSQASTVSVTPRSAVASSASSWCSKPSRRKSLRYLAKKLNTSVSPDADWKLDQREAFQRSQTISLSSSTQSTPTRSAFSSAQPSPQSGLGRYGQSIIACTIPAETSSSKRQMPPRRCKKLSPPTVPVTSSNRKGIRRRR